MKRFRLVFIGIAALAGVVLLALAVAFSSSFQTWAVRRALAGSPGPRITIGSVAAGLSGVRVQGVRVEQPGLVLTVPALEADLPLFSAAWSRKVLVSRATARGWVIDLSQSVNPATRSAAAAGAPAEAARAAVEATGAAFAGIFGQLQLPVDLAVDNLSLEGEVILPGNQGTAKVSLAGGGLGAGREARFDLTGDAILKDPEVNRLTLRGTLGAAMDSARSFSKFTAKWEAAASGRKFPQGLKLNAEVQAARTAAGENYSAAVESGGRSLLSLQVDFPRAAPKLSGDWKVDFGDTEIAPFALGMALPSFAAVGGGKFDADVAFSAVHVSGRLTVRGDRLGTVRPELAAVGAIKLVADFDLAQRGPAVGVERLEVALDGAQPVANIRLAQPFSLDLQSRELKASALDRDLLQIVLQGVPLAWARPVLPDLAVTGSDLRGELVAVSRAGGLALRTRTPLQVAGLSVAQAGKSLLKAVDVSLPLQADYSPQGWQAEVAGLSLKSGSATFATVDAKAGQLAGDRQPLKATGRITANLPALAAQPAAAGMLALTRGEANVDFVANLLGKQEYQARLKVQNLAVDPKVSTEKLPTLAVDLRADVATDGQLTVSAPILIERDGRKSDLTFAGTLRFNPAATVVDGQVTSANFVVDDAKILAVLLPAEAPAAPAAATPAPAGKTPAAQPALPPWAGVEGAVKLGLKKVVYSDTFLTTDVNGTLRLGGGALKFEKLGANMGEGGFRADGGLTFDAKSPQPYGLAADVAVKDFDPAPFFKALNPKQPPTVEGKFNATTKISAKAASLEELAGVAGGELQLVSPGGVFRGIPVSANNAMETTGKVAGWIASAGTAIGALTGKREYTDIASKAQALAELTSFLRAITYDQLNVVTHRDGTSLSSTVKDITLISPEIRLTGSGTLTHRPGTSALEDTISAEFKLRARGRVGDLLKYLGILDPQVDDLGYSACTLPLKVAGTVGKPDTTELNRRLASLALEKSGATDLLNRLIGGK